MNFPLTKDLEFQRLAPDSGSASTYTLAAGTTDVNTPAVDTQSCHRLTFVILLGAIASGGTYTATIESSADGSTWATTGKTVAYSADTDDNKLLIVDIVEPTKRYYRIASDRGTGNTTIDGMMALLDHRTKPVTQGATVETTTL